MQSASKSRIKAKVNFRPKAGSQDESGNESNNEFKQRDVKEDLESESSKSELRGVAFNGDVKKKSNKRSFFKFYKEQDGAKKTPQDKSNDESKEGDVDEDPDVERSIHELWEQAIGKLDDNLKKRVHKRGFDEISKAKDEADRVQRVFQVSRHPSSPHRTQTREYVRDCLNWLGLACEVVNDQASGPFSEPVSLVASFMGYMIKAAQDVTNDLNLVEETLQQISEEMKRITSIGNGPIQTPIMRTKLVEVLIALLKFFSYVEDRFKRFNRFRLWFEKITRDNGAIQEQCGHVIRKIKEFEDTLTVETVRNVHQIREGVHIMDQRLEGLITDIRQMMLQGTEANLFRNQTKSAPTPKKITDTLATLAVDLKDKLALDLLVVQQVGVQRTMLRDTLVKKTFAWLGKDRRFSHWQDGKSQSPFLLIRGEEGYGKSHLIARCTDMVIKLGLSDEGMGHTNDLRSSVLVTHYFFKPAGENPPSVSSVIAAILCQIASHDQKWCEYVANILKVEHQSWERVWTRVIEKFETKVNPPKVLYVFLDDIQDMEKEERKKLLSTFSRILTGNLVVNVRILLTVTPKAVKLLADSLPIDQETILKSTINLEKSTTASDVNLILDNHLGKEKLRERFKSPKKIKDLLVNKTDGKISLIDQWMSLMGEGKDDERTILEVLDENSSFEDYALSRVKKASENEERIATEFLFTWCAFSKRPLTIAEMQLVFDRELELKNFKLDNERVKLLSYGLIYGAPNRSSRHQFRGFQSPPYLKRLSPDLDQATIAETSNVLRFRYPSLRERLQSKDSEQIRDRKSAEIRIFTTLSDVLCDGKVTKADHVNSMHKYAAVHFLDHLNEIPKTLRADPNACLHVLKAIYQVLEDKNKASRVFEKVIAEAGGDIEMLSLYHLNTETEIKPEAGEIQVIEGRSLKILAAIKPWIEKLTDLKLPADAYYTDEILKWASKIFKHQEEVLDELGKGHRHNWAQQVTHTDALIPYKLAAVSTRKTRESMLQKRDKTETQQDREKDQKQSPLNYLDCAETLLEMFDSNTAELARARIAAAILLVHGDNDEKNRAMRLYKKNIHYLGEHMGAEMFYSFLGLAEGHAQNDANLEKAGKYAKKAIQYFRNGKGTLAVNYTFGRVQYAFVLLTRILGDVENKTDQKDNRIDTLLKDCFEYRRLDDTFVGSWALNCLINRQAQGANRDTQIMGLLRELLRYKSPGFLRVWLLSATIFGTRDTVRKAAYETGQVDFLIELYETALKYSIPNQSFNNTCHLLCDMAEIYYHDARVKQIAEEILHEILARIDKDSWKISDFNLNRVMREYVDILFERSSKSQGRKTQEEIIDTATWALNVAKRTRVLYSWYEARILLILARIFHSIGNIEGARKNATRAFEICIADLEDLDDFNDSKAFRSLARVLNYGGFKSDAAIAISLQFSKAWQPTLSEKDEIDDFNSQYTAASVESLVWLPDDHPKSSPVSSVDQAGGSGRSIETTRASQSISNPEHPNVDMTDMATEKEVWGSDSRPDTEVQRDETRAQNDTVGLDKTAGQGKDNDGSSLLSEVKDTMVSEHVPDSESMRGKDTIDQSDNSQTLPETETLQRKANTTTEIQSEENDLNLIRCNGFCGRSRRDWQEGSTWYFCLVCMDVDYCSECYEVEKGHHVQYKKGLWLKSCWGPHGVLKQPMEGWKGVRHGVIHIGNQQRRIVDWLADVKHRWAHIIGE